MKPEEPTAPAWLGREEQCPLCGGDNQCRVAKGHLYKDACWCQQVIVPSQVLGQLAQEWVDPTCLCPGCLDTIARVARELKSTGEIVAEVRRLREQPVGVLSREEYYYDPDGKMVFTAAYHLKRGSCCANRCRHCPY